MIAAPCSGSGKTTVTCALLEVLKNKGLDPVSFKCGPDYIDPLFHKKVLGIESRNLDVYFEGIEGIRNVLSSCHGRYAVAEGVMGIYDGIFPDSCAGSCYETASVSETPIILVINASGTGRTVISLVRGILSDDSCRLIKGIILNRMSGTFYDQLKPVFDKEISSVREDVRLLGYLPECRDISIESRHLGLRLPSEIDDIRIRVRKAASALEETVDIDSVTDIMEKAAQTTTMAAANDSVHNPDQKESQKTAHDAARVAKGDEKESGRAGAGLTLAVAYDDAFCFYYRDNLDIFTEHGVRTVFFSPLKDKEIPADADGLLFGGGYPEDHLPELSSNRSMLASVKNAINKGIPSLAECGGFMYLHRSIKDMNGKSFEMAGLLDGECAYSGHLVRFGYMRIGRVKEPFDSDELYQGLSGIRGHEFHYYESSCSGDDCTAEKPYGNRSWDCMTLRNNGIWGFPHFYYGSAPGFITSFIERMRTVRSG